MSNSLNAEKALIFRIVHRDNVPWILENGMHCFNSVVQAPEFHTIGNPDIIERRRHREVPIEPNGTLSDYIPFYFTPFSPMMLNIKTGYAGVTRVANEEIVIFVTSLHKLVNSERSFVFTNKHAYLQDAEYYNDIIELKHIDWDILQNRDFKRDIDDLGKGERYQAEALVHQHLPAKEIMGIICYNTTIKDEIIQLVEGFGLNVKVEKRTGWYF